MRTVDRTLISMGSIPRPLGRKAGEQPAGLTLGLILRPLGRGCSFGVTMGTMFRHFRSGV